MMPEKPARRQPARAIVALSGPRQGWDRFDLRRRRAELPEALTEAPLEVVLEPALPALPWPPRPLKLLTKICDWGEPSDPAEPPKLLERLELLRLRLRALRLRMPGRAALACM